MSKPHYFTKQETITGSVSVWAFPASRATREAGGDTFTYQLRTDHPWDNGATCVYTEDNMSIQIPAGIDLLAKTIETLKKKKEEIQSQAYMQAQEVQEQINGLLMLSHQPDPITHNEPTVILADDCYGADTIKERMNANLSADDLPF